MRRVELLIDTARKLSQNTRYDSSSGIPQDIFVQFFNNAQDTLTMEVQNLKTKYFKTQLIVDVVPNQEVYDYPPDCYMQHLDTIQWTDSITGTYWQTLYKSVTKEKVTLQPGYPFAYIPFEDGIHLNPPITSGQLWMTFVRTPKRLQKRAGQVSSLTLVGQLLSALTVNPAESSFDETEINTQNYLCVCDKYGNVKASNIPYTSVNSSGVFTLSSYTLESGQTIAVGDYILVGENCINIPQWSDICEGYLIKHAVYEAKYGDSSSWTKAAAEDMDRYFQKLSGSFATLSDDITDIPITALDYIGF
jgi:hypothetical protein